MKRGYWENLREEGGGSHYGLANSRADEGGLEAGKKATFGTRKRTGPKAVCKRTRRAVRKTNGQREDTIMGGGGGGGGGGGEDPYAIPSVKEPERDEITCFKYVNHLMTHSTESRGQKEERCSPSAYRRDSQWVLRDRFGMPADKRACHHCEGTTQPLEEFPPS